MPMYFYCCPLKVWSQYKSKIEFLSWNSVFFVTFVFTIKTCNNEQRYTFYRTAAIWSVLNAIKIQIWVTLVANLLLMVMQKRIKRIWSFSEMATIVRIMLIYYINCYTFLEQSEKDRDLMIQQANESPPEPSLFDWRGAYFLKNKSATPV